MTRLEANRRLVIALKNLVEKYPTQRFGQVLLNFGFVSQVPDAEKNIWKDEYNLESDELWERVFDKAKDRV